ncbi:MAG: sugar phosphate isomerase [Devosia sp.]|nr:sugar phosphate isomerase [Devosia sp.]
MSTLTHCFSTLGCPDLSVHEAAELAQTYGIEAIELRVISGSLDIRQALAAEFGDPATFARWLENTPISIVGLGTSARLFGDGNLGELEQFLPWAEAARVPYLRIFDGGETLSDSDYAQAGEKLSNWQAKRQRRGLAVDLMVETHDALAHPAQLSEFVTRLPAAAILWDAHHTWAKGGADPVATWRSIAPYVVHVHVKDSVLRADGRHYVLPGQGEFPMAALLPLLEAAKPTPISLEWERHWHNELPPLDQALHAARSWW